MTITLRGYQRRAIAEVRRQWAAGRRSTVLVMATGLGKTICFAALAHQERKRTMILADREELVAQAAHSVKLVCGEPPDIEQAERRADQFAWWTQEKSRIVVGTIQTQISGNGDGRRRMERFDPAEFGLLVIDECDLAAAASYKLALDHYLSAPHAHALGVTATPTRHDRRALPFEGEAFRYEIADAVEDGWLVSPLFEYQELVGLDLSAVPVSRSSGDFREADLVRIMDDPAKRHTMAMVEAVYQKCLGRRTLVFCAGVGQGRDFTAALNAKKADCARFVSAGTPADERRWIIADYRKGAFPFLVNVGVCTRGFDVPEIESIVIARPTCSRTLYAQMIGRGTRPLPGLVEDIEDDEQGQIDYDDGRGESPAAFRRKLIARSDKPVLNVIEFTGNAGRLKLASAFAVYGGSYSDAEIELACRRSRSSQTAVDVRDALRRARLELEQKARREAEAMRHIRVEAQWRSRKVDPFNVLDIQRPIELGFQKGEPASDAQCKLLAKFRVPTEGLTKRQASRLIGECLIARKTGRRTYAQAQVLKRYGYQTAQMSYEQAHSLLNRLAANGWKRLSGEQSEA